MSEDETTEAEFGGWRKRRGKDSWEPKEEGRPYVVHRYLTKEGSVDKHIAVLTGAIPVTLKEIDEPRWSNREALTHAQLTCESHWRRQQDEVQGAKLGVAAALSWQETEPGSNIWEALADDGGRYTCTEIGATWRAGYSFMGLVPLWPEQGNLAEAQLLCDQHNAGRGLKWRQGIGCWLADDNGERDYYACEPNEDNEQWSATDQATDTEIWTGDNLDEAQAQCQIHRGKRLLADGAKTSATALDWAKGDDGVWTAPGPGDSTYSCEQDTTRAGAMRWFAALDEEELGGSEGVETLEAAQVLCQQHHDSLLVWREAQPGAVWNATSAALGGEERYSCALSDEQAGFAEGWLPQTLGGPEAGGIGSVQPSLELAQGICQEHHRATVMGGAGERDGEMAAWPETMKQLAGDGPPCPGQLPAPQRADWVIPVPLTEAEMAEAFEFGRKLRRRKRSLRREVAASHDRHKKLAKRNQELIDKLEDEIEELDEQMPERPVDCVRSYVRDGEEVWVQYTRSDPHDDGGKVTEALHEHKLTQFEQRQLFGEGDPPADKPPPSKGEQLLEELDAAIKRAFDERTPEAITAAGEAIDAAAEHLQAEQLKRLRARQAEAAATMPKTPSDAIDEALDDAGLPKAQQRPEERKAELKKRPPLKWGKIPKESTYLTKAADPQYRIDLVTEPGVLLITTGSPGTPSRHEELHRWTLGSLGGAPDEVKRAKAWCQQHRDSRLEWPGEAEGGVLLNTTGRYQLSRYMVSGPAGKMWQALYLPGQDQPAIDLGDHLLPAAKAACQEHADELRRAGR